MRTVQYLWQASALIFRDERVEHGAKCWLVAWHHRPKPAAGLQMKYTPVAT